MFYFTMKKTPFSGKALKLIHPYLWLLMVLKYHSQGVLEFNRDHTSRNRREAQAVISARNWPVKGGGEGGASHSEEPQESCHLRSSTFWTHRPVLTHRQTFHTTGAEEFEEFIYFSKGRRLEMGRLHEDLAGPCHLSGFPASEESAPTRGCWPWFFLQA